MKVSESVIERYVWRLTMGQAASALQPMADLDAYDDEIDEMGAAAVAAGELELLRLSLDALIAGPRERLRNVRGQVYSYPGEELPRLLRHAYSRLWPEIEPSAPGTEVPVDLVRMSDEEWAVAPDNPNRREP